MNGNGACHSFSICSYIFPKLTLQNSSPMATRRDLMENKVGFHGQMFWGTLVYSTYSQKVTSLLA